MYLYVGMSPVGPAAAHENYNIIICAYNVTLQKKFQSQLLLFIYHYFIILFAHAIRTYIISCTMVGITTM